MIYLDPIGHLMSDTSVAELHEFATTKLGFKRSWFQDVRGRYWYPHYDCTTDKSKQRAINAGAKLISAKELLNFTIPHLTRL